MEPAKKLHWVKIAESVAELFLEGKDVIEADAEGKKICVARFNNELFAFANKCPHASGLLKFGQLDASGNISCPLHRYKFSIKTGRNISGEGYFLKHWPVSMKDEGVYVGLDNQLFTGLL